MKELQLGERTRYSKLSTHTQTHTRHCRRETKREETKRVRGVWESTNTSHAGALCINVNIYFMAKAASSHILTPYQHRELRWTHCMFKDLMECLNFWFSCCVTGRVEQTLCIMASLDKSRCVERLLGGVFFSFLCHDRQISKQ